MENHVLVREGFRTLLEGLAPYVARELQIEYGSNWWRVAVLDRLYEDRIQDLPLSGDWGELVDSLDESLTLNLFNLHWNQVFRKKLSKDHRAWANELVQTRNKLMHLGGKDFSDSDTWRALDTMSRLDEQIDPDGAEELRNLLDKFKRNSNLYSNEIPATNKKFDPKEAGILNANIQGLPSWRDVIEPHPDVAKGKYKNAEFAANLNDVAQGKAGMEYQDPVEFYKRTYITEGISGLLIQGLKRIGGKDGEPVIQLKTAFGGGKTHSMLALYHLLNGGISLSDVPQLKEVLYDAGLNSLPRANVAVLVGTALNPATFKRPGEMPGVKINTIWGEMAYQLARNINRPELFNIVKEADAKHVAPGTDALVELFDKAGPCLILMDELVAYAKTLYGRNDLPAGTLDNFITFIQQITEAARSSKNSMVVASIPESEIEVGGQAGQETLEAIEHTFGRMEAIWKPVAADEGFEVVRRRLFLDCKDTGLRDKVCNTFSQMYLDYETEFPIDASKVEYRDRMISCYPIHPEVFDRLYNDWATLERFQRTRGVLRLMAAVIHELWMGNDAGAMIMPGSIQLSVPSVRDELTRHLSDNWNAIVDKEVDGKASTPYEIDRDGRFGKYIAGRRVARTIMLGSAPTERGQSVRGIETNRIRLGVVQPGENISVFNDALNKLRNKLQYLYSDPRGDRFWYDTRPTLRKTAEDKATQFSTSEVEYEIEQRLSKIRNEKPLSGIHISPSSSLDIPDEQAVRLVILRPEDTYKLKSSSTAAMTRITEILSNRGTNPRVYKNMLAFIAPDENTAFNLGRTVRQYLAWNYIYKNSDDLNLDKSQIRETESNIDRFNETVNLQLKETYSWLIVPNIDRDEDLQKIEWNIDTIRGGSDSIVKKAINRMITNEDLIPEWAPMMLKLELDDVLWTEREDISIKELWDYLTKYCYLPRLANYSVLEEAIRNGLNSPDFFGLAAGISNGRYLDLKYNQPVQFIDKSNLLVKPYTASKQIIEENKKREEERKRQEEEANRKPKPGDPDFRGGLGGAAVSEDSNDSYTETEVSAEDEDQTPMNTSFFLSAKLDNTRIGRDVKRLVEEVITHLQNVDNSDLEVRLEVNFKAPDGVSSNTVRTVSENCNTLKVDTFGFDD